MILSKKRHRGTLDDRAWLEFEHESHYLYHGQKRQTTDTNIFNLLLLSREITATMQLAATT